MSEFKFVQWGKNVPVDYQRLNAMMLNDQYLKDYTDASPRGLLAKAECTSTVTTGASGIWSTPTNMSSIGFTTEANRNIKYIINGPYVRNTDASNGYLAQVQLTVDNTVKYLSTGYLYVAAGYNFISFPTIIYVQNDLSVGAHTAKVEVRMSSLGGTTGIDFYADATSPIVCYIEDIGSV